MTTELIPYAEGGVDFDAFVARPDASGVRPDASGVRPAVLVSHAWAGRESFEEDKARALAQLGYVGVAIDLYGVGKRGTDVASNQALMNPLLESPAILRGRLEAAYEAARALPGVDASRVGIIGYCFGGLCAILAARMGLDLRGAVSFHGLLKVGERLDARPVARILVEHGQDDPMAPPSDVGDFAAEMKRIDADWQLHAYPGVVHAFTNPAAADKSFGTVYDAHADRQSWLEMTRFFEDVFVA